MGNLNILFGLDLQAPAARLDHEARVISVLDPLLQRLAEWSQIRLTLHVGGPLIKHVVEAHPRTLKTLIALLKTGRIELLGGGFHDPFLGAIPEHDATGQIHLLNGLVTRTLGYQPRGAWLRGSAWRPNLPAMLNRCGFTHTLLDEAALDGRCGRSLDGYHIAESDGFTVAVFPIHRRLQRRLLADGAAVDRILFDYAAGEAERTAVLMVDDVQGKPDVDRIAAVLNRVRGHAEWIRTYTLGGFMESAPPAGRTYPATPCVGNGEGPVDWEQALTTYPEVNFLHKRMLMASYHVHRVRRKVQAKTRKDPKSPAAAQLRTGVQEACTHLWKAQNHRVYWHREDRGLYDARQRQATYGHILAAERLASELLKGRTDGPPTFEIRAVDFDCDGRRELLVDSGEIGAIISPHRGGGLMSLELKDRDVALGSVMRRHAEPYHGQASCTDIQLVLEDEDEATEPGIPAVPQEEEIRPWFDRRARLSFMDHFLDPGTTAENWSRNLYREAGDFLDAPYEILRQRDEPPENTGVLQMGRNGTVRTEAGSSLVRVEKKFLFSTTMPRVRVEYRLINRYFEPAPAWFGIEANFALFGSGSSPARFRAMCAASDVEGRVAGPRELQRVGYLELIDTKAKTQMINTKRIRLAMRIPSIRIFVNLDL